MSRRPTLKLGPRREMLGAVGGAGGRPGWLQLGNISLHHLKRKRLGYQRETAVTPEGKTIMKVLRSAVTEKGTLRSEPKTV